MVTVKLNSGKTFEVSFINESVDVNLRGEGFVNQLIFVIENPIFELDFYYPMLIEANALDIIELELPSGNVSTYSGYNTIGNVGKLIDETHQGRIKITLEKPLVE